MSSLLVVFKFISSLTLLSFSLKRVIRARLRNTDSGEYSELRGQILLTELFPKNCDSTCSFENDWHYSSLIITYLKIIKMLKFTTGMETAIRKYLLHKKKKNHISCVCKDLNNSNFNS